MSLHTFTELQTARIAYLAGLGFSAKEIALDSAVSASPEQIAFYVDRLGLPALPKPDHPRSFSVTVPFEFVKDLDVAGLLRNLTRAQIAEKILCAVLAEKLINAVLDDGVR